jgi:ABC-2 type transport system permease protein
VWDKQFGFLKETFVAPISRFQILLGKTLGGATVAAIQGILVFLITLIAGFRPYSLTLLPVALLFLIVISFLFSAVGTTIAARLDDMQGFPLIINFIIQPLFFLSGAIFPIIGIPPVLAFITKVNPLSYGIDGLRFALSGSNVFPPLLSLSVLIAVSVIIVLIGMYQFSKVEL